MQVLVTGASGFLGLNLCTRLRRLEDIEVLEYDVDSAPTSLGVTAAACDVIFHLAGVNRPKDPQDFERVNTGLTQALCRGLIDAGKAPKLVLASSIQALLDNPYGRSKRAAEVELERYAAATGAAAVVHRLKNLFGKWCRPNYNSVTATFCHNIAHGLPIAVSNPENVLDLTHVDDVVAAFVRESQDFTPGFRVAEPLSSTRVTLGELVAMLTHFRDSRRTLELPDLSNPFVKALYGTYLSYLPTDGFAYGLAIREDQRGSLAEFMKQPSFGQIFVSHTKPGVTRGNHFHHTKTEKFMVVAGQAVIRFRQIAGDDVIEYPVRGEEYQIVDIPPGYTHSIENTGDSDLVTLFWACEVFDPERPDTMALPVSTSAEGSR